MPVCKKCNKSFPNYTVINDKRHNLGKRKYCLDCSPFGLHNTRKLSFVGGDEDRRRKLQDDTDIKTTKLVCQSCGREYLYFDKDGKRCGHTTVECNSCKTNKQRWNRKKMAIEYKGGKCCRCGYDKCEQALNFHHIDPATKTFSLSSNHCRSWESVKKELDKCVLLCANCHAETHNQQNAPLAQRLEREIYNLCVPGSNPGGSTEKEEENAKTNDLDGCGG